MPMPAIPPGAPYVPPATATYTSNATAPVSVNTYLIDATAGNIIITMQESAKYLSGGKAEQMTFKRVDSNAAALVVVNLFGGELVDGVAGSISLTLASPNSRIVSLSAGGGWVTLGSTGAAPAPANFNGGPTKVLTAAAYTVTTADFTLRANAAANVMTLTLPPAASAFSAGVGQMFNFKKVDASTNAMVIKCNGAETLDGSNTRQVISQYMSFTIQSNGTGWDVI